MTHDLILQHLKGATRHQPVTLEELASKTGLLPDTISMLLDQMQNTVPATINKVKIIKNGKAQIIVWPTGAVQPFSYRNDIRANGKRRPDLPAHAETKDPATNTREKVSNADVVKYVITHPGSTTIQVTDHFAGGDKAARNRMAVMLHTAIKRGYLNKIGNTLSVGANEIWLAQHGLLQVTNQPAKTSADVDFRNDYEDAHQELNATQTDIRDINAAHPEIHPAWVEINGQPSTPEVKLTEDDKQILCEMAGIPAGARKGGCKAVNAAGDALKKIARVMAGVEDQNTHEQPKETNMESIKMEDIPKLSQASTPTATNTPATIWPNNGRNENKLHEAVKTLTQELPEFSAIAIHRGAAGKFRIAIELGVDNGGSGSHFYLGSDIESIEKIIEAHQTLQQFARAEA